MAEESQPPPPSPESRAVSLPDGQYLVERLVAKRKRKVWTIWHLGVVWGRGRELK